MPSQLEEAALRFRGQLLRQERQAASEMVRAYAAAWQRVQARLDDLQAELRAAEAAGLVPNRTGVANAPGTFPLSWLYERNRMATLLQQVEAELRQFAALAGELTEAGQLQAVMAAQNNAVDLVRAAAGADGAAIVGMFDRLPRAAVQDLVGFAADGSPLRELFDALGPRVSLGVQNALVTAVATGMNPRSTARLIRQQFGMGLSRALTIARTEQVRAYRETTRRSYAENSHVVQGWTWISACDGRSCPSCFAMHGTHHAVTEKLDDHPNGRCVMAPRIKGYDPKIAPGEERFRALPLAVQQKILGKAAHLAYQAGAVRLSDFVGRKDDPRWGTMRYARSLREILGKEEARKYVSQVLSEARTGTLASPKKSAFYRSLQAERIDEVRAMSAQTWRTLQAEMRQAQSLPKRTEHFRKHGKDFADMRVADVDGLERLFVEHIQRPDLRLFTYISTQKATQYRLWALVGMDNGVVALYNQDQKRHWSIMRPPRFEEYLTGGRGWWLEVEDVNGKPRVRKW